ncbi:acetyltransferase [Sporosarcina saromensis]|uniref:Acetyltransferase n=1 Tax=Sporosarcina saromensis TaxID=359365 RepID=A0ABU4G826_9BACL|nr:acetyltransferase [Sporosarcina saromensis]MDW0113121.1 acetyltransferase [Sporosarcina saromensis]
MDDENNNEIVGYFTLLVKPFNIADEVSGELRKKLSGNKNTDVFNSILIAQLGKSDLYKGKVSGNAILEFALENCELAYDLVGLRIVCVEYDDVPYLNDFYLNNDFKILQVNCNQKILAYLRF